jgi:hypothetical protein
MKLTPGEVVFPMVPAYVKSDCYIPSDFSLVFLQDFFLKNFFIEMLNFMFFENFNISENNIISVKLKLGQHICGGTTNSKPLGPIIMIDQRETQILFITLFFCRSVLYVVVASF